MSLMQTFPWQLTIRSGKGRQQRTLCCLVSLGQLKELVLTFASMTLSFTKPEWIFAVDFSRGRSRSLLLALLALQQCYVARSSKAFSPRVVKKQVHAALLSGSATRGQWIALDSALRSFRDLIRAAELSTQLT